VTTSRYNWGAVRDVARDELCDFRFRKQLDTATAPVVDIQRCAFESTVFAVAVGLLQPEDRSSKGLLSGCKNVGWSTVRHLRKAFNNELEDLTGNEQVNRNAKRRWTECKRVHKRAEQTATGTARAMDLHLAYAVGVHAPREAVLDHADKLSPVHRRPWTHIALMVGEQARAYVNARLPEESAKVIVALVAGCELSATNQTRAEHAHPINELRPRVGPGRLFKYASSLAAFAAICKTRWADVHARYKRGDTTLRAVVSLAYDTALVEHTVELEATLRPGGELYRAWLEDWNRVVCPVCSERVDRSSGSFNYEPQYARYEACAACKRASGPDVTGGDLLQLALTSPAGIMGAARLAQHAGVCGDSDLRDRAEAAIRDHMRVEEWEKVALAEAYETSMQYEGNCCAVCGVRNVEAEYVEMYFSLAGDGLPGPAFSKTAKLVQERSGLTFLKPAYNKEQRRELRKPFDIPESTRRVLWLSALPDWLVVPEKKVEAWGRNKRKVYVEHDDETGMFVQVDISALDLRHVMRPGRASKLPHLHLIEEAVADNSGVALMFVCATCGDSFPRGDSTCKGPPINSMAKRDYGRRYLPSRVVRALHASLKKRGGDVDRVSRLLSLSSSGWRLPIASRLETALLAKARVHVLSFKIAEVDTRRRTSKHAVLSKHTMYFPLSLMDDENEKETVEPWKHPGDAKKALEVAVKGLHIVFVGPNGKFEDKKRALLSMEQVQLRPKVVFTLLALLSMHEQQKAEITGDAFDKTAHVMELSLLEKELARGKLESLITKKTVHVPRGDHNKAAPSQDHDHAGVRSGGGCHKQCDDGACAGNVPFTDANNTEASVMLGLTRFLQRGGDPIDDYGGQPQALYDTHFPLFPLQDGLETGKKLPLQKTRHLCLFYDCRFAHDHSLLFELADTLSRHAVNSAVGFSARNNPAAQKRLETMMRDDHFRAKLRRACRDPRGDEAVALLHEIMPFVHMSARRTPYTNGSRASFLGTLFAHHRCMGASNRASLRQSRLIGFHVTARPIITGVVRADFVSVAPDDVRNLHSIRDSRPFRRIGEFPHVYNMEGLKGAVTDLRGNQRGYDEGSLLRKVVCNPVAATAHFHHKIMVMNRELLGIDPALRQTGPFITRPKGLLGRLRSATWVKECNERKSQHVHMLTYGSMLPGFLSIVASIPKLRDIVTSALDTQVRATIAPVSSRRVSDPTVRAVDA
jgi:hypothetical protein